MWCCSKRLQKKTNVLFTYSSVTSKLGLLVILDLEIMIFMLILQYYLQPTLQHSLSPHHVQ